MIHNKQYNGMNIKKLAMTLFALLLCMGAVAQVYHSNYRMSAFDASFEVVLVDGGGGAVNEMLHIFTLNDEDFAINIDGYNIEKTINILEEVRSKFSEWKKTAKDNNVKDFEKVFPTETCDVSFAFKKNGEWHITDISKMYFAFIVSENGTCSASFYTKDVKDCLNGLYTSDGGMISLVNEDEITGLINAMNPENILKKIRDKEKIGELFK